MSRFYARTNSAGGGRFFARTNDTGIVTPIISSVSNPYPRAGQSITVLLTGGGASQGAGSVTVGGVAMSITSWADQSITGTVNLGTNKYGAALNVVVTRNDASASAPKAITGIAPPTGWDFVNLITPHPTAAYRITATADAVAGDQLSWETVGGLVTVNSDLTFAADVSVTATGFNAKLWHTGDGYGASGLQTFEDQADPITFTVGLDSSVGQPITNGMQVDWFLAESWGGQKVAGAIDTLNAQGNLVLTVTTLPGTYYFHYRQFGVADTGGHVIIALA